MRVLSKESKKSQKTSDDYLEALVLMPLDPPTLVPEDPKRGEPLEPRDPLDPDPPLAPKTHCILIITVVKVK